jgi:hypothetical protein
VSDLVISTSAALILGFLIATAYGDSFHFIMGGPAKRIILYVLAAWLGFTIGHLLGDFFNIETFKLGAIHLLTASLGAWLALFTGRWLGSKAES